MKLPNTAFLSIVARKGHWNKVTPRDYVGTTRPAKPVANSIAYAVTLLKDDRRARNRSAITRGEEFTTPNRTMEFVPCHVRQFMARPCCPEMPSKRMIMLLRDGPFEVIDRSIFTFLPRSR